MIKEKGGVMEGVKRKKRKRGEGIEGNIFEIGYKREREESA